MAAKHGHDTSTPSGEPACTFSSQRECGLTFCSPSVRTCRPRAGALISLALRGPQYFSVLRIPGLTTRDSRMKAARLEHPASIARYLPAVIAVAVAAIVPLVECLNRSSASKQSATPEKRLLRLAYPKRISIQPEGPAMITSGVEVTGCTNGLVSELRHAPAIIRR